MSFSGEVIYATDEERIFFAPMLPEDVREAAELVIGCVLDGEADTVIPGGVLAASGFEEGFVKIDFLYVPKRERRKGIGREMMSHLKSLLLNPEFGIESFQCAYVKNEHTEDLDAFLTAMGFEMDKGAETFGFLLGDLDIPKDRFQIKGGLIQELGALPARYFNQLADELRKRYESGEEGKAVYIPLEDRSYYDPDYSFLYIDENSVCQGCALVSRQVWGFMLEYVCCLKSEGTKTIMALLSALLKKGAAKEPPHTMLRLSAVLKSGGAMLKLLCNTEPVLEGVAVTRVFQA